MNNQRREKIRKVAMALEALRDQIEELQCEEQEAFDNMPESLQDSERGQVAQEAADNLQTAYDDLDTLIGSLGDIADA